MKLTHFLIDLILKYIYGYILVVLKLPQSKGKKKKIIKTW